MKFWYYIITYGADFLGFYASFIHAMHMFRPVLFPIFSICTPYLVGKVYHTDRSTN